MQTQVIRDKRRKKTLVSYFSNNTLVIRAPIRLSQKILDAHISKLEKDITQKQDRKTEGLAQRVKGLNQKYFQGMLRYKDVQFSKRQNQRFGSCTPMKGTIRLSHNLLEVPDWVLDYVIVHELAHLLEANHSKKFWELVYRYPKADRARGYLEAMVQYGKGEG